MPSLCVSVNPRPIATPPTIVVVGPEEVAEELVCCALAQATNAIAKNAILEAVFIGGGPFVQLADGLQI